MNQTICKARRFKGKPRIPGDKSISHRGLIFGALAQGRTEVLDILESADVQSTARCLGALGVRITKNANRTFIDGLGSQNFKSPTEILDCGNSGTTMRLLMGVLAGGRITATLSGDASLVQRPMNRVAEPLRLMGAQFILKNQNFAPLTVKGSALHGIDFELKIASAQIKTAIILAALSAQGTTTITGEIHSRDHTERLLKHFGVLLSGDAGGVRITGAQTLRAAQVQVPGDPSTAAFWMGAASLVPGGFVEMENIALNPTRTGFLRVLKRMGASVTTQITAESPEPVGKISVISSKLRGVQVTPEEVPSLIDEIPLLAVLATQAIGVTHVQGAEELRVKESDRLEAIATGLRAMGIEIEIFPDGFKIQGPQVLQGAALQSFHDHRIAMALSIAALVAEGETLIEDADCVAISYPEFFRTLEELTHE